jgi:diphosphomevalonate decarboxylase
MTTRTHVRLDECLAEDRVVLGDTVATGAARSRVVELLDRVRRASGDTRRADVVSRNDFPTASGLASSASGFAALALAAVRAAGLDWDAAGVSDLARRSSASAARSVFGGFVELDAGRTDASEGDFLAARPVAPADHLPLAVLVCVTTEEAKAVGSSEGMAVTMQQSPFAAAWLEKAPDLHAKVREALLSRDFRHLGALAEASALAMHATAIAAGIVYWNGGTLAALARIRALRGEGMAVYASIDAGPHVKVLVPPPEAPEARQALERTPGVLRVLAAEPGEGARVEGGTR